MQVSELLRLKKKSILKRWEQEIRNQAPSLKSQDSTTIKDSVPDFLNTMADALEYGIEKKKAHLLRVSHKHGSHRTSIPQFTISDVLNEFNLLRKITIRTLEEDISISGPERDIIAEVIHIGVCHAGMELTEFNSNSQKKLTEDLRGITDIQPTFIAYISKNLQYLFVNKSYETLFKTSRETLIGQYLPEALGKEAWEQIRPYVESVMRGKSTSFEKEIDHPVAGKRYMKIYYQPSFDEKNKVKGFYTSILDLTDQYHLLEKEKRITRELYEEKSMREKFVYTLSHDLRTPLTAAKMAAQIIERNKSIDQTVEMKAQRVVKNIDRINTMIQDLLDAGKLQTGQVLQPDLKKISPKEIIEETLKEMEEIFGKKFQVSKLSDLEAFSWEEGLRRILENLSSNAIKYGDPDRPIEISLTQNEDLYILKVRNYGEPISETINPFNAFEQGITKKDHRGWGIGLTIVRGLSESMGGAVRYARHKDGTTFEVFLPKDSRNRIPTHSSTDNHH